jgi:hypothetical protein
METITNLLIEVVKKVGGTTLAFIVVIGMIIGGGYAFQVWNENKATTEPPGNKTIEVKNESGTDNAGGIYTPVSNQTVKVRVTGADGTNIELDVNRTSATITQIGSSAYTTLNAFTGATSGVSGAAGGVPAPIAGEQNTFLRGNGTFSKPVFSGARRFASAGTSIPNTNADTVVSTGTVDYVVGSDVTTSVANQIAIVTTGYYRCTGSFEMTSGASTARYAASIRLNGVTAALGGFGVSVSTTINPQVTATLFLTTGEIISLGALQNSGGAQSTVSGSSKTYLEVEFLGI